MLLCQFSIIWEYVVHILHANVFQANHSQRYQMISSVVQVTVRSLWIRLRDGKSNDAATV